MTAASLPYLPRRSLNPCVLFLGTASSRFRPGHIAVMPEAGSASVAAGACSRAAIFGRQIRSMS